MITEKERRERGEEKNGGEEKRGEKRREKGGGRIEERTEKIGEKSRHKRIWEMAVGLFITRCTSSPAVLAA